MVVGPLMSHTKRMNDPASEECSSLTASAMSAMMDLVSDIKVVEFDGVS